MTCRLAEETVDSAAPFDDYGQLDKRAFFLTYIFYIRVHDQAFSFICYVRFGQTDVENVRLLGFKRISVSAGQYDDIIRAATNDDFDNLLMSFFPTD